MRTTPNPQILIDGYAEGLVSKCAEHGIDAEELMKWAQVNLDSAQPIAGTTTLGMTPEQMRAQKEVLTQANAGGSTLSGDVGRTYQNVLNNAGGAWNDFTGGMSKAWDSVANPTSSFFTNMGNGARGAQAPTVNAAPVKSELQKQLDIASQNRVKAPGSGATPNTPAPTPATATSPSGVKPLKPFGASVSHGYGPNLWASGKAY